MKFVFVVEGVDCDAEDEIFIDGFGVDGGGVGAHVFEACIFESAFIFVDEVHGFIAENIDDFVGIFVGAESVGIVCGEGFVVEGVGNAFVGDFLVGVQEVSRQGHGEGKRFGFVCGIAYKAYDKGFAMGFFYQDIAIFFESGGE